MDPKVILAALPEIITQLVAFLAVFFILKKFAFGSVFQSLDDRQKAIETSIKDADRKRQEMEVLKKDYEQRIQVIEQEARQKIQASIADGQRIAAEIRDKAQADAAGQLDRAKLEIQRETEKAQAVIRQKVVELSAQMAGKLIAKNLSTPENEKYVMELLSRTGDLS
jgi:F-type H+-transporting ATPase subunit b